MSTYKLIDYSHDFAQMRRRMYEHIEKDVVWLPATARTPGAVWCDVSTYLDAAIRQNLSVSLGHPLYDIFWICDYRQCRSLQIHKDNPGNEYPIVSRFTIIMMIEGRFEVSIWEDDEKSLIDKVVIHPGQLLVLNNSQYYHSGAALDDVKLSLHAYPKIPEIDNVAELNHKISVTDFV